MTFTTHEEGLDELGQLLQDPHQNNRHDIWLWLSLFIYEKSPINRNTCNGVTMRETIAHELKRNPRLIAEISHERDYHLVPDEDLAWITNDDRQIQWLLSRVDDITGGVFPRGLAHLIGRSRIVAMLDIWKIDLESKKIEIERLHGSWRRHIARDSQFEWFADKKEGKKRCICAWEWIEKHHSNPFLRSQPISNYSELLKFFDQEKLGPHEQKAMIQEIKKRWNRKQFDERTSDKKQVNVLLKKDAIELLDQIAEQSGMKRAQILETLIRNEFELKLYLTY